MKMDILIIGVGNTLRRDDGIGPLVIQKLKENGGVKGVDLLDGGTDGLALLEYIKPYKRAVIIDAVDMGAEPGMVRVFSPEEAKLKIKSEALSTHGLGLAEVLGLMAELGIGTEVKIIGVQPGDISLGEGLNEGISAQLENISRMVRELI